MQVCSAILNKRDIFARRHGPLAKSTPQMWNTSAFELPATLRDAARVELEALVSVQSWSDIDSCKARK